jgi:hypothetical protein
MSLVSCDLAWEEEARFRQTGREWRAFYKVLMSRVDDGPLEILNGRPDLAPYQKHKKDTQALVSEWYPRRIVGTNFWDLELLYSTDVEQTGNPLNIPALVTIQSNIREVPALFDIDGFPIVNTAGMLLTDPPATRKLVDQVIRIAKNIPLQLPEWTDTHPGAVNNDAVRIRGRTKPPGTLFCAGINVGEENNVPGQDAMLSTLRSSPFTVAEIELWYRADGWTEIYLNAGYYQQVPVNKTLVKEIKDETNKQLKRRLQMDRAYFRKLPDYKLHPILIGPIGDPPPHPWPLDANGRAIPEPNFDNIIFLEYDGNKKRPFNLLPLK